MTRDLRPVANFGRLGLEPIAGVAKFDELLLVVRHQKFRRNRAAVRHRGSGSMHWAVATIAVRTWMHAHARSGCWFRNAVIDVGSHDIAGGVRPLRRRRLKHAILHDDPFQPGIGSFEFNLDERPEVIAGRGVAQYSTRG
jgi:hypothetical protein